MKMLHFKKASLPIITIVVLAIVIGCSSAALFSGIWWGVVGLFPAVVIFFDTRRSIYRC